MIGFVDLNETHRSWVDHNQCMCTKIFIQFGWFVARKVFSIWILKIDILFIFQSHFIGNWTSNSVSHNDAVCLVNCSVIRHFLGNVNAKIPMFNQFLGRSFVSSIIIYNIWKENISIPCGFKTSWHFIVFPDLLCHHLQGCFHQKLSSVCCINRFVLVQVHRALWTSLR